MPHFYLMLSRNQHGLWETILRASPFKFPRIWLAVSVVMGAVAAWWLACASVTDPIYQGKPLSLWLQTYDPSAPSWLGSTSWVKTDEAVGKLGTNCLPLLLNMLADKDSGLKTRLVNLLQRQSILKFNFVHASTRNIEASRAFVVLGETAKDAVPAMTKLFEETDSVESRVAIEHALSWIGPAARSSLPAMLEAATNSNSQVRAMAMWALGDIHGEPAVCVPVLIQALGDADGDVRTRAAHALGTFGMDAAAAVPALTNLANNAVGLNGVLVESEMEAWNALSRIRGNDSPKPDDNIFGIFPK